MVKIIEYKFRTWFRHIFDFHRTDTLRKLFWEMWIVAAYTFLLAWVHDNYWELPRIEAVFKNATLVVSSFGFVLTLLLVFRTNTAYDRWWEGRKLWGALVNSSRNLALKISTLVPASETESHHFFKLMIPNFCFSMKEHLRDNYIPDEIEDTRGLIARLDKREHRPNLVIQEMYREAKDLVNRRQLSPEEQIIIDKELKSFADIMGACERIKKTPIPYSYNIFLKKYLFFYLLILPLGFIVHFDYWAIPIASFIFYILVSLEMIGEEIEDPFGRDPNDLPTDDISRTIRRNVYEIFDGPVEVKEQPVVESS